MAAVVVRPAAVAVAAVVQIAEEAALLLQVQDEQWAVPVLVVVVVLVRGLVLVWVLVSAEEYKSDFHVLHGSAPIMLDRLRH